jgi:molecular chaperone IbpA
MGNRQLTTARDFFDPWMHQSFGLDHIFHAFQQFDTTQNKYPPHNIIKSDNNYILEFALAGWKESEITVELEKNILKVSGQKADDMSYFSKLAEGKPDPSDPDYVHRGIANRSFIRQFTIGDNIKIVDGNLKNGMLTINMDIIIPEEDKPKTIKIVSE